MSDIHPSSSKTTTKFAATSELPACVMAINANDPSGAGGLAADVTTIVSVGGHPLPIVAGVYVRDTGQCFDHYALEDDAVVEQARAVLEDLPVQVVKVGFVGSPENVSAIAELTSDYADLPVIAYMPDLSWWQDDRIDQYHDAFRELLLPQTTVLVGNHNTLWRWLLPEWDQEASPSARDLAAAAAEMGVPYTLVTGIALPEQFVENILATPETVVCSGRVELFDATFAGAGDTLSAALAALLATGCDLTEAFTQALGYLDACLEGGFRPGMGHVLPDRMFWAEPDDTEDADPDTEEPPSAQDFGLPPHDTKH
ncbi:MAG: bifunctional hydroxymethylpyrimidine kinase/phosphomethylpyrimidine kinase [Giesbergeria sp.]